MCLFLDFLDLLLHGGSGLDLPDLADDFCQQIADVLVLIDHRIDGVPHLVAHCGIDNLVELLLALDLVEHDTL